MSPLRIVVTDTNLLPLRTEFEGALPAGSDVVWAAGQAPAALPDSLAGADVLVGPALTPAMAAAAPGLRLVQVAGAGTDKIDPSALAQLSQGPGPDVIVANTFNHERSIAEYVVWAALTLRRQFLAADAALREGTWRSPVYNDALPQLNTLQTASIGFVGFGHIGSAAWDLLRVFGAHGQAVTGSGNLDAQAHGLRWAGANDRLDDLLTESDVVVVSAPLNAATEGMIGAEQLAKLGSAGILINVARGPIVDEHAIFAALQDRTIAGAALDVWYTYPGSDGQSAPSAEPFGTLDNVLMTPHLSGITHQTFLGRTQDICANITALAQGTPLTNIVRIAAPNSEK